jgi:methyltransferase (TIGR00027 family)
MGRGRRWEFLIVATALLTTALAARAVPPGGGSFTAVAVCEFRAIAAQHPDPKLRNGDTLAGRLCPPALLPHEYDAARDVMDVDPEAFAGYFFVNARTHYIDALLEKAAAAGAEQVVVLGAGFDSRAYRFHDAYPKLKFFEVDLPAVIEAKKRTIERVLGSLPTDVHYAPIDFNTQSLSDVLPGAGYDPRRRSFFILEGVSMYVAEPGVAATLEFVSGNSAAGSEIVYDYVLRRVTQGDYEGLYAARKGALGVAQVGEPFVTGWTPQEAADFAKRHGLAVREDLDATELTRRYLTGSDGQPDGRIPEWYRVIDAEVR